MHCDTCDIDYANKSSFYCHLRVVHEITAYTCRKNKQIFNNLNIKLDCNNPLSLVICAKRNSKKEYLPLSSEESTF